jgi:hypothetical protein
VGLGLGWVKSDADGEGQERYRLQLIGATGMAAAKRVAGTGGLLRAAIRNLPQNITHCMTADLRTAFLLTHKIPLNANENMVNLRHTKGIIYV